MSLETSKIVHLPLTATILQAIINQPNDTQKKTYGMKEIKK